MEDRENISNENIIEKKNSSRKYYLDILKIISCIAVIVLHTCSRDMKLISPFSNRYQVLNFFDSFARFAVPIFVMVSGALFLDRNKKIDTRKLYTKNILRLVIAYILWSIIYGLFMYFILGKGASLIEAVQSVILKSYFHLWFLPMIISIYILIPFLKKIADNSSKKEIFILLLLFFIFKIIGDTICAFDYPELKYIQAIFKRFSVKSVAGYIGYFFLGHYLSSYEINKKNRILIYILGILGVIICTVGNSICSIQAREFRENFLDNFVITTFFATIAVFTFIKYSISKICISEKVGKFIKEITANTFGIYLVHMLFMDYIRYKIGFSAISINTLIYVPMMVVIVWILSDITVTIIRKVPVINKYIV